MTTRFENDVIIKDDGVLRGGSMSSYKGDYSITEEYRIGDIVFDGELYLSISVTCSNPNIGNPLTNPIFWVPYSSKNYISATSTSSNIVSSSIVQTSASSSIDVAFISNRVIVVTSGGSNIDTFQMNNIGFITGLMNNTSLGTSLNPIRISPTSAGNTFLGVVDNSTNSVYSYLLNNDGSITSAIGSPYTTGNSPISLAFSPNLDPFPLYVGVANFLSGNVSFYGINVINGQFIEVSGSPFPSGNSTSSIAFTPVIGGNLFAGVVNGAIPPQIVIFQVDYTTGNVSNIGSYTKGTGIGGIDFSPVVSGNVFCAAPNFSSSSVSVYIINSSGTMIQVPGSPFATNTSPNEISFSPVINGNLFLAILSGLNNINVYSVNPTTGFLTQVPGSPFTTGNNPTDLSFSPVIDGRLFCSVVNPGNVRVYNVDPNTGVFTLININYTQISDFTSNVNNGFTVDGGNIFSTSKSGKYKVTYTISGTSSSPNSLISYVSNNGNVVSGSNISLNSKIGSFLLSNSFIFDYLSSDSITLSLQADIPNISSSNNVNIQIIEL